MQQVTFQFDDDEQPKHPRLNLELQREQQLVEWMAQAIVLMFHQTEGEDCDND